MIKHRFSKDLDIEFSDILRKRVNNYFIENNLEKGANSEMVYKSITALSLYLLPYFIIVSTLTESILILFGLWIIMGLGKAFVGASVMHDAVHGSYSRKANVNKVMSLTAQLIGMDPEVWKIQHNVLHHTYPNIEDADEDIAPRFVMRFSPNQPRKWFHRYQHIYVWFFYSLSTFLWVLAKDFFKITHYKNEKLLRSKSEFNRIIRNMIISKAIYLLIFLSIPMYMLSIPIWLTFLMFFVMHLSAGLTLSLIFQPAHVISTSDFVVLNEVNIERNWSVHQLMTTSNFAMKNKFITWVFGGLNFQVEHHLFPNICHIHYPRISEIVRETTLDFGLPYYAQESFSSAVVNHYTMLKELGRKN